MTPPSATRPNAVSEWWETPRCRGRGSASEMRSAPIASPPSTVTALHASPAATPEKPHGVPVPRLPGPWVTIGEVGAQHVPRRQQPGVHGDRLEVAAERLAHGHDAGQRRRQRVSVREKAAASAPPSVIT